MSQEREWERVHSSLRNKFFGEVKHRLSSNGRLEVELVVMPDPRFGFELAMAALAVDGSRSMIKPFAFQMPPVVRKRRNTVQPVAQDIALHLARNAGGRCALAYWACGDDGGDIEPIDILSTSQLQDYYFEGPQSWGGGTKLTPIVRYLWENVFAGAANTGLAAILTDGAWDDQDQRELLSLTQHMCEEVSAGRRHLMKLVLLSLKTDSNAAELPKIEQHFTELNDYDSGTTVDIWDHKWVDEVEDWNEMFIEPLKDWPLGVGGRVLDGSGREVLRRDEFNYGIEFDMPAQPKEFTLVLDGIDSYKQSLPR